MSQHDIEERLHVRIKELVPDDQPLVSLSVNRGVPLIYSHKRSAVARAIQTIAQDFIDEASATRTAPVKPLTRTGLFNRVFHRTSSADV